MHVVFVLQQAMCFLAWIGWRRSWTWVTSTWILSSARVIQTSRPVLQKSCWPAWPPIWTCIHSRSALRWPSTFRSPWRSSPSRWIPTTRLNWAARCVWSNPPKSCWLHPTSCWLLVAATRRTATAGSPNPRWSLQAPPEPNPTPDPTRMLLKRRAATRQTATAGSPNPRWSLQAPPEPNPTPDPTRMLLKWCIRNRRRWSRTRRQRRGTGRRNAPSRRRWTPSAPSWRRGTGSSRRKPRLSAESYGTWEIWWRRSGPPSTAGSEPSTPSGPVRLRHSFIHSSTGLVDVLDRSRVVC